MSDEQIVDEIYQACAQVIPDHYQQTFILESLSGGDNLIHEFTDNIRIRSFNVRVKDDHGFYFVPRDLLLMSKENRVYVRTKMPYKNVYVTVEYWKAE